MVLHELLKQSKLF